MEKTFGLILFSFVCVSATTQHSTKPNIIFILSDDLGYNDVGFRNPEVITPNIDELARGGIILEQSYVQPLCTPSRSAFLTGMYPFHIGRQGFALLNNIPTGLTLDYKILPQYLKDLGYSTHLVGKWHLGFCKEEYLPTNRGFDTSYGYWSGGEQYYTKMVNPFVFDFHEQDQPLNEDEHASTTYSTTLYKERIVEIVNNQTSENPFFLYLAFQTPHTPHAVPAEYEDMYPNITDSSYKTYYAMITAMDEAIGEMISELKASDLYDNTVIVLLGDNGAPPQMTKSNLPLRGFKNGIYEGGVRTPGLVHSPLLKANGSTSTGLIHITDWLPTLLSLAGMDPLPENIDGINQASMLLGEEGTPSARREVVYNIKTTEHLPTTGAIRVDDWKLLVNPYALPMFGEYELYNLEADPFETQNVKDQYPDKFQELLDKFNAHAETMVPVDNPPPILTGNVEDGVFITGWC